MVIWLRAAAMCVSVGALGLIDMAHAQGTRTPAPAPANDLQPVTSDVTNTIAGPWDLQVPKNKLKCRIQLSVSGKTPKAVVGMPAACRQTFGAMANAETWAVTDKGAIRMFDRRGGAIGDFTRVDAGVMKVTISSNEFTLEPVTGRYPSPERIASVDTAIGRLNAPAAETPTTPVARAGRYQLIRANNADTGCVLLLDRTRPGPIALSGQASLEKGCPDKGLQTFDPAGWIVERDRLFLYARKGHRFGFNIERTGQLVKDPPAGSPLLARKLD
jgi:Protease inhibitor Inh